MMRLNGRRGLIAGFGTLRCRHLPAGGADACRSNSSSRHQRNRSIASAPAGPDAAAADRFTLTAAPLPRISSGSAQTPSSSRRVPSPPLIRHPARENLPSSEALAAAGPPPVRERPAAQTAPASAPPPAPVAAPLAPPKPIVTAAATPIVAVARAEPLTERDIVDRANAFFNEPLQPRRGLHPDRRRRAAGRGHALPAAARQGPLRIRCARDARSDRRWLFGRRPRHEACHPGPLFDLANPVEVPAARAGQSRPGHPHHGHFQRRRLGSAVDRGSLDPWWHVAHHSVSSTRRSKPSPSGGSPTRRVSRRLSSSTGSIARSASIHGCSGSTTTAPSATTI